VYVVVVGGGRIGYYLSKALLAEGHEVLIIEQNNTLCKTINDELGSVCFFGDGCEASILEEIGTGRADMLIAVTGDDEDNMVACQVAKHRFNVPRTIARIRNPKNEILFKKLGIDVTVSSTDIILESIEKEVPTHPLTHLMEISDKGLELVEIKITPESKIIGKAVKDVKLPVDCVLSLIIRKSHKPIIPTDGTIIEADDQIIAVTPPESEGELRTALIGG
jgi:trk system potassium uptake protein TrkA